MLPSSHSIAILIAKLKIHKKKRVKLKNVEERI
jgi:hypothetical protein